MNPLLAQSRIVELVLPPEPSGGPNPALWIALAGAAALALPLALHIRRRRSDPAESAFRKLARAAGFGRTGREALRRMAGAAGIDSPVALLLSPSAMLKAASAAQRATRTDRRVIPSDDPTTTPP
jgi:hypothetical protein